MIKKYIIILLCILLLTGCNVYYIDNKNIEEIIDLSINVDSKLSNINNKGYRYYLPVDFEVFEDGDYNPILLSKSNKYYMYLDIVSYYYGNNNIEDREEDDYAYYSFEHNDKKGYVKIKEIDNKYWIEISYNYAIIEVNVEGKDVNYALTQSIIILSSVSYNDLVIKKYIGENDIESSETIYKIPSPEKKSNQNVLEHIDKNENSSK